MAVLPTNTYIGERYVPIIAGEWEPGKAYENLVIVTVEGNSYISKQYVPANVPVTNTDYWLLFSEYNQQLAALQTQVSEYQTQVVNLSAKVAQQADEITELQGSMFPLKNPVYISNLMGARTGTMTQGINVLSVTNTGGYVGKKFMGLINIFVSTKSTNSAPFRVLSSDIAQQRGVKFGSGVEMYDIQDSGPRTLPNYYSQFVICQIPPSWNIYVYASAASNEEDVSVELYGFVEGN